MSDSHQQWLFDETSADNPLPKPPENQQPETDKSFPMVDICSQSTPPPDSLEGQTVYIVDSHSLIYQLFHALPEMTGPKGQPVAAVYGFARDMLFLLEEKRSDYLFCAFDLPGKTFRHDVYAEYKANRSAMPDDLIPQVASIRRLLTAVGIPALGAESFEADDVLATVARLVDQRGGECVVVTADKDCRQLITDRVVLLNLRKKENAVLDRKALEADWGIRPDQVVDYQSLVGDPTDNVPGVPLIGPKLARELLEKYDTLDEVLAHAGEVSGKKRKQNLVEYAEQARLSRTLVKLDTQVPLAIDWEAGRCGGVDVVAVEGICDEFGFRGLTERARALSGSVSVEESPLPERPEATYHLVDTPKTFAVMLAGLREYLNQPREQDPTSKPCISVDLETTHLWPRWAEIVGIALAWKPDEGWYVAVRAPEGEPRLALDAVLDDLRDILEDPEVGKVGQNLKYDMIVFRSAGIELRGLAFDTMVASYLISSGQRNHNLDELARRYLNHTTTKISELIGKGKNQKRMDEVPASQVSDYAGEDAVLPLELRPILAEKLDQDGLNKLFVDVELPLVEILVKMESRGIRVDVSRLAALSERFGRRMNELEAEIETEAGRAFNIASPKQLQKILFDELKLPVQKKTAKSGPSTDVEVLTTLAAIHPLPAKILEYRHYAKLKGTYADALPGMVHPETGRVHASLNQAVTATGRLSSSDPNLQNIPIRTPEGRLIRSAFVPGEPDWLLLGADYSQIELRVLAHFTGEGALSEAFARDEDIHARVASEVFDTPLDEVTSEMRRKAKAVNFGVIYGQSAYGLAKQLGIDKEEAGAFIDSYFLRYPEIEGFLEKVLAECRQLGYVETILGRRRAITDVRPKTGRQLNLAERTAINTVIQGSAADLIKLAMIGVDGRLHREGIPGGMLLQIHDELVFEVPSAFVDQLARCVTEEMIGAASLTVPLKVDVRAGADWGQTEAWEG